MPFVLYTVLLYTHTLQPQVLVALSSAFISDILFCNFTVYILSAITFTGRFACDLLRNYQVFLSVGSKQRATTTLDFIEHVTRYSIFHRCFAQFPVLG